MRLNQLNSVSFEHSITIRPYLTIDISNSLVWLSVETNRGVALTISIIGYHFRSVSRRDLLNKTIQTFKTKKKTIRNTNVLKQNFKQASKLRNEARPLKTHAGFPVLSFLQFAL